MPNRILHRGLAFLFCALLGVAGARGQQASAPGSISGRVLQQETGNYLEGATVEIEPRNERQLTTDKGEFAFMDLPAGDYTLRISYLGLDAQTLKITLAAGASEDRVISMTADVYKLERFVVTGEREGNAAALVAQQNAPNVVNDVAIDAYGPIADGNIAQFLQFLPGVDNAGLINGEVGSFGVRGMEQAMSTVTMDGSSLAAANAAGTYGDRSFPIDIVPAEMIESVRLTKSPTPDMAADSIGGNVNLKTKSALSLKGRRFNYNVGGNNNTYRDGSDWRPTASFSYMDRFGPGKTWAITVAGSHSSAFNTQDRLATTLHHANADNLYTTSDADLTDSELAALWQTNPDKAAEYARRPIIKTQVRFVSADVLRDRSGGSVKLEKKLGKWRLGASAMYNLFKSKMNRSDPRLSGTHRIVMYEGAASNGNAMTSEAAIRAGGRAYTVDENGTRRDASIAPGYTETVQEWLDATMSNYVWLTTKRTDLWRFMADAEYKYSRGWLRLAASRSQSESHYESHTFYGTKARGWGLLIDEEAGSGERPVIAESYNQSPLGTIFAGSDVNTYTAGRYSFSPQTITDETLDLAADWNHRFSKSFLVHYIQAGAAWRSKDYVTENNTYSYDYVASRGFTRLLRDKPSEGLFNGYYPAFDYFDFDKIKPLVTPFGDSPDFTFRNNATLPAANLTEDVTSAYVMTGRAHGRFSWLAGVRMEHTDVEGAGNVNRQNTSGTTIAYDRVAKDASYTDWFPGAHLRYDLTANIVLRASWSRSMGRPSIARQIPSTTVREGGDPDDEDAEGVRGTISQNNTGLKPMYSDNYDISFEWYFSKAGIFSAGVFERRIDGYIVWLRETLGPEGGHGFGPEYYDYRYSTQINMNKARVRGLEFNYNQALSFLPAALRTMRLSANATLMETEGSFDSSSEAAGATGTTELPGFKNRLFNIGLTWPIRKFQVRVFYNYNAPYLSSYNEKDVSRTYKTASRVLNANLQWQFSSRYVLFADFFNMLNAAPNDYVINPSLITVYERNGMRVSVGIKGRF
ncbi:MAG: TonB-dependent receptor [Opitutaceae bacterium]|jgi:TonB-dependent receptor|nr:TonB-dependent receptor [Opitutaceae bacterium]